MPLYLVGETIDKKQAHQRAESGEWVQIMRGIYVDADDAADETVLGHAVRIAHYLYPTAYLSGASAQFLGPTPDGRLFISGRRNQRTRLRGLEIIQNVAPERPSLLSAVFKDPLGEFTMDVSSPRFRFLEAFRVRSEHASAVSDPLRAEMASRLSREFGSPEAAADALWTLARENGWYREGEFAERHLLSRRSAVASIRPQLERIVAWHGAPIGRLTHDGTEWRWAPEPDAGPRFVRQTIPGKLPPFIASLLPEGWLEEVLSDRDERAAVRHGKRFLSNIAIVESMGELASIPTEMMQVSLTSFTRDGVFSGTYAGPTPGEVGATFEARLARLFESRDTPRLSGVQIKAPMSLLPSGRLEPAVLLPFTHILKPAGASGFELLPVVEWVGLELGRVAGFDVPPAALVEMPSGLPPALVIERFDLRGPPPDRRLIALEDFCSVLGVPTSAKYDSTIERAAKGLRGLSTSPSEDLTTLFRRALFSWLIADGDMHLKNLSVIEIAQPGDEQFESVRMAPLYDVVTTRVFPRLAHDRMALRLNGKDDRLGPKDFEALAKTMGIGATRAREAMAEIVERLAGALPSLEVPSLAHQAAGTATMLDQLKKIVASRLNAFAGPGAAR